MEDIKNSMAWVIERFVNSQLHYWDGHGFGKDAWTQNPDNAIRFARDVDANTVLGWPLHGEGRVVQHSWSTDD